MSLKKFLFLSLILAYGTISTSCPMLRNIPILPADNSIIKEAAYYKIHGHDGCKTYSIQNKSSSTFHDKNPKECPAYDLLTHAQDCLVVTYHNKSCQIIAIVDITNLNLVESEVCDYAKCRLDPNSNQKCDPTSKPKAVRALIFYNKREGRIINFYDRNGTLIFSQDNYYDKPNKENFSRFESYIDLSTLKEIDDQDTDGGCIIF